MKFGNRQKGARLRIVLEPDIAIGPGKADILESIRDTGSIAAAGRRMDMSYKRAWSLVDAMNRCFREPLVETTRGGDAHGGAHLTEAGDRVLACYRRMESSTRKAIREDLQILRGMLADPADPT